MPEAATTSSEPRRLVLFDIDGTLLFSRGAGRRSITRALIDELGSAGQIDGIRFDGKTDPQIIEEFMEAADHPLKGDHGAAMAICDRYLDLLETELQGSEVAMDVLDGVEPLLAGLGARDDVVLGLLTGNLKRGARLKLDAVKIDFDQFVVGAFGSDNGRRSRLPPIAASRAERFMGRIPSGSDVVIIGDTPADVTCGDSIGARAIGVATGSYSVAELAEAGAYLAVEDLSDTNRVLEAILD